MACSGFGACAHAGRLVQVDVAVGQRDLRAEPRDIEAAALPEGMVLAFRRFKESASIGAMDERSGKRQLLGFGGCSGFGACVCAAFGWRLV